MADAGEHVVERTIRRLGEADAVGRHDRHVEGVGQLAQRVVVGLLVAQQMPLQLQIGVVAPEHADEPIDAARRRRTARRLAWRGPPSATSPGVAVELVEGQRPLPFRRAQLHHRQQPAEISVAVLRFDEDREAEDGHPRTGRRGPRIGSISVGGPRIAHRQLRADDRLEPRLLRGEMKARRAVDAVAIEQRQRRIAQRRRPIDERLRQRRAVEKRKRGRGVEFDVHGSRC